MHCERNGQYLYEAAVAGGLLSLFSKNTSTGFYKDGYCRTGPEDSENHTIAATLTDGFLSSQYGSEASSQGLRSGDRTCLSASQFASTLQAAEEGKLSKEAVPKVHLHASQDKALDVVSYKDLKKYAAEPEAFSQQGRQESHHDPTSNRGIASESSSIGGDQGNLAPGAGSHWKWGEAKPSGGGQRG